MTYDDFYLEFGPGGHWKESFGYQPDHLIFSLLDLRELLGTLISSRPEVWGQERVQAYLLPISQPVFTLHGIAIYLNDDPYDEA